MGKISRAIAKLARKNDGVAAVEFAMVLPILASIVICLPDLSQAVVGVVQMESAAQASIQYAMAGGIDMSEAQSIGMQAWTSKPANAALTTSEYCLCGGSAGTCGVTCPDGSIPGTYVSVTASGRFGGSVISFQKSVTRAVRIL
jgi:Flp pilus assembly protein TadG